MNRRLGCALVFAVACGSAGPPHGPKHTPANSPEPATLCEPQRDKAKSAREEALEVPEAKGAAAAAILVHAECELEQFAQQAVPPSSMDAMLAEFRILKTQYFTTQTLLEEVIKYDHRHSTVGALTRLGDLNVAYATKLRGAPAPSDLPPARASAFKDELGELARGFDAQAKLAYVGAVDAADDVDGPDDRIQDWTRSACRGLEKLDPAARQRRVICSR